MSPDHPTDDDLAAALKASGAMLDAPEHLIHRAIGVWRAPAPSSSPASPWGRLLARLRFDSALQPALALGLRSAAGLASRQIVFTSGDHDIDLHVTPHAAGGWTLTGQVLGPVDGSAQVCLWQQAQPPGAEETPQDVSALGEWGEFRLAVSAPGTCYLAVCLGEAWISLPPLELAPADAA